MLVYKITNTIDGKIYVGCTGKTVQQRWRGHISAAKTKTRLRGHLQNAINKYGPEAFIIEVIYVADSADEMRMVERAMIAKFGCLAPGGYNMTTGGEMRGGHRASPQTRQKLRDHMTSDPDRRNRLAALGYKPTGFKHSEESKRRMSTAQRGLKKVRTKEMPDEQREKHRQALIERIAAGTWRLGAFKGHKHTDDTKRKMSAARLGWKPSEEFVENFRQRVTGDNNVMRRDRSVVERSAEKRRGQKRTPEQMRRISEGIQKNRKISIEQTMEICSLSYQGVRQRDIMKFMNIKRSHVSKVIRDNMTKYIGSTGE